jgi:hypothetical protein
MSHIKPFRPFPPLSSEPRRIITGCDLVQGDEVLHGDLWELGDSYIFNAVGDFRSRPPSPRHIALFSDNHLNYFERRNVFVFLKASAQLSFEAAAYLARAPR